MEYSEKIVNPLPNPSLETSMYVNRFKIK